MLIGAGVLLIRQIVLLVVLITINETINYKSCSLVVDDIGNVCKENCILGLNWIKALSDRTLNKNLGTHRLLLLWIIIRERIF